MSTGKLSFWVSGLIVMALLTLAPAADEEPIDLERAHALIQKQRQGETLTDQEQQYLRRAMEARRAARRQQEGGPQAPRGKTPTGLVPLCDMGKDDKYNGQDGGLYGVGRNDPPADHAAAARRQLRRIQPLDPEGKPSPGGKIVLLSIGMSNTRMEFSAFGDLARKDPARSAKVVVVNAAIGGMDVVAWAKSRATRWGTAWEGAERRLKEAGATPRQVQVLWLKQAKMGPASWGEFPAHARKLADGMATILNMAKERYPNLQIAYLSSRIYAGYANTALNPEPYAYESAFSVRWLIQEQISGDPNLNYEPSKGPVKCPLLLWGPYLWADGTTPRKSDDLVWLRDDLAADGTHPSDKSGTLKVGRMLLEFFQTDPLARTWYLRPEVLKTMQEASEKTVRAGPS